MPLMGRFRCLTQSRSYLLRQTQTSPSRMADSSSSCLLISMKSSSIKNSSFSFWYPAQSSPFISSMASILSLRVSHLLEISIRTRSQYCVASNVIRKMKCEYTPSRSFRKYLQMRFSSIIIPPRCLERLITFHCNQGQEGVLAAMTRLQLYRSWMIRCRQRQKGRKTFSTSSRITPLEGCCWMGRGEWGLFPKFWRSCPISLNTPPRLLVSDFRSFSWMACTATRAESASDSVRQPPSAALWRKMWTIANFLNVFVRGSCPPLPSTTFKVSLSLSGREGVEMRGYIWWQSSRLASFSTIALKVGNWSGVSVSVRKWWFLRMRWCQPCELRWVMWAPIDRNILLELIEYQPTLSYILAAKGPPMRRCANSQICNCSLPQLCLLLGLVNCIRIRLGLPQEGVVFFWLLSDFFVAHIIHYQNSYLALLLECPQKVPYKNQTQSESSHEIISHFISSLVNWKYLHVAQSFSSLYFLKIHAIKQNKKINFPTTINPSLLMLPCANILIHNLFFQLHQQKNKYNLGQAVFSAGRLRLRPRSFLPSRIVMIVFSMSIIDAQTTLLKPNQFTLPTPRDPSTTWPPSRDLPSRSFLSSLGPSDRKQSPSSCILQLNQNQNSMGKNKTLSIPLQYATISLQTRQALVALVISEGLSIGKAARRLKVKLSTAKMIVKRFRLQGDFFESKRQKQQRMLNQKETDSFVEGQENALVGYEPIHDTQSPLEGSMGKGEEQLLFLPAAMSEMHYWPCFPSQNAIFYPGFSFQIPQISPSTFLWL